MADIINIIQTKYYYLVVIFLMMIGLYATLSSKNLIKKVNRHKYLSGLSLFILHCNVQG